MCYFEKRINNNYENAKYMLMMTLVPSKKKKKKTHVMVKAWYLF